MNKEVQSAGKIHGTLNLPADKSISHRSVMFAALHDGISVITNFSTAADPFSTIECLRKLGVTIKAGDKQNEVTVEGVGRAGLCEPSDDLDCGNSGTTMRLLSGMIAGAGISARLVGDQSLSGRTMERIIVPLRHMGAMVKAQDDNYAPLKISRSEDLTSLNYPLPIPSAQLKSCILLAGLFGEDSTEVIETLPSRDHTERLLRLPIEENSQGKIIRASLQVEIPEQSYRIPNDFSAAAFWLVAGSIHSNADILLKNVGINPTRTGALKILQQMGADVAINELKTDSPEPSADLQVRSAELQPVEITPDIVPNCIDELPILAIAMLFANGVSQISGAEELRHKETDRLAAVADILSKAGADFKEYKDGLKIYGDPAFIPASAVYESYHDHRIAMSAAILSLLAPSTSRVKKAECTAISYPSFWKDVASLTK